ncbi:MAG TPA: alkene reductase [Burkholderiales bacterium]|nr:alkene reductase [Burkholderiales bacterium]
MPDLFAPVEIGPLRLANRLVMAPMSRNRADAAEAAHALTAKYYEQRAGAGLIVTEASPVSPQGRAGPGAPGIWSNAQVAGWRLTTQAVHARGGRIFVQLWHAGKAWPGLEEIPAVVAQFAAAARNARDAEFDGVEVHAANGYLIDRFLRDGSNRRADAYGGSVENRARFLIEVLDAVESSWERSRIGVRLSPVNPYNDMSDSDPQRTFADLARRLGERGLAFLHVDESGDGFDWAAFRRCYAGTYIANGGYDRERAAAALASGHADLVSFGALYLANPDLVERFRAGAPLNRPDRTTFYGGGERGYTDYPALAVR